MNKNEAESVIKETIEYANNEIEKSNKKRKKEEKLISNVLSIALILVALAAFISTKLFTSDEAMAATALMSVASLIGIVATWVTTTICLRKK